MNTTPSVSIVMCTYNGAAYLREQLASFIAQTHQPCELIVGDDCSTDETVAIVEEFARTAPFAVSVVRNERQLGYAENFLSAAARATGDYISFSDQDDIWAPDKLERGLAALIDNGALLSAHTIEFMESDGTPTARLGGPKVNLVSEPSSRDPWGNFYGFTMLLRRDVLEAFDPADRGLDPFTGTDLLSHDRWVYFVASNLGRVAEIGEPLALYRQHQRQLFGGPAKRTLRSRLAYLLERGFLHIEQHCRAAVQRRDLLSSKGPQLPAELRTHLTLATSRWERLADYWTRRSNVYSASRLRERFAALRSLIAEGAYSGPQYGEVFTRRQLAQDAVLGVLLATVRPWRGPHDSEE